MRRVKRLAILLTVIIAFFGCSFTSIAARTETDYSFVFFDGDISTQNYQKTMANYCVIPLNVRENFQLAGWKIIITDEQLEDTWFPGVKYVNAGSSLGLKEIRLEDTKKGANAVVHEVGHYVYWNLDLDTQNTWNAIWEKESSSISKYAQSNIWEGFAEAFYLTWTDADFSERCPESYNYVVTVCDTLKGLE